MHPLASKNLYPECISLHLDAIPKGINQFDLKVSLNFNEQWQSLLNGRIKFGLKGGKLSLKLDNSTIAITEPNFGEAFTVTSESTSIDAHWILVLKTNQWVFKGELPQLQLGTITGNNSYYLTACFEVSAADISILDAEGLWKHDISPNKHGVLERKLALFWWEEALTPYVSLVQLSNQEVQAETVNSFENAISSERLSHLQQIIDRVYDAKTNDLHQLSQLAGLNPLQDFAGGNLLAGELSTVTLSGANLHHINLRGAVLTDADLSEANLNYANLSGVDLSGAYLGNANLRDSNFYKASLALANLIGADLRGAKFKEVNLSQTNLSGARVEGAVFEENVAISEEVKQSLQERGALVL